MDASKVAALLGRPLTTVESTNFDLYLDIAEENVYGLLCIDPAQDSGERTFDKRKEMSTVFTGIFTKVNSVTVDGKAAGYVPYFWDNRNSEVFNSIVLDSNCGDVVVVDADWGFDCAPKDLQRLIAQAFAVVSSSYQTKDVTSKRVEDFSITFGDLTDDDVLTVKNARVIRKYSLCAIGDVQNGSRHGRF